MRELALLLSGLPDVVSSVWQQVLSLLASAWPFLWVFAARFGVMLFEVARMTFTSQGRRGLASVMAFVDSLLWLSVAAAILADLTSASLLAWACAVAAGQWAGMWFIHQKLRLGLLTVRVFSKHPAAPAAPPEEADADGKGDASEVTEDDASGRGVRPGQLAAKALRDAGFGATVFVGEGRDGQVDMVLATIRRRNAQRAVEAVREQVPDCFISIDNYPGPGSVIGGVVGSRRL